jgi:WD40 repeat protein
MVHDVSLVNSVGFSSDGGRVVSGGEDDNVKVWDSASGEEQACMAHDGDGGGVKSVSFSSDGGRVVSGCSMFIKVWDSASGEEILGDALASMHASRSSNKDQRSRGLYRIELVQDKSVLQLLMSTSEGDVEVGYIYLGPIEHASFNTAGSIFVTFRTLAPQVVEVVPLTGLQ